MVTSARACIVAAFALTAWLPATLPSPSAFAQGPPPSSATPSVVLSTDAEREAFLRSARVIRERRASSGVTGTIRATLSDGVVTHDASIQTIDQAKPVFQGNQGTELNFKDSWRFNLAAYKIDRLLEIGMIPSTVQRRHRCDDGSFTWWVDDVLMDETERHRTRAQVPDTEGWNQQMWITRMFDQLIANVDRNLGNLLIDRSWNIWMIDHSRAFRLNADLRAPGDLSKIERGLLARLRSLDLASLERVTGDYLTARERETLLARRDRIVEHFDKVGASGTFERRLRCC